jgi:hypothetical protein
MKKLARARLTMTLESTSIGMVEPPAVLAMSADPEFNIQCTQVYHFSCT